MSNLLPRFALAAALLIPGIALADDGGATAGAVTGGVAGAVVGGPVGAAVGAGAGAVVGGAVSGPNREKVIVERPAETTGTVVETSPCRSKTVQEQSSSGASRTTTSTNCP
jgi:uncharacterized protein YcfJ